MIKLSTLPVLKRFLGTDDGLELKVELLCSLSRMPLNEVDILKTLT